MPPINRRKKEIDDEGEGKAAKKFNLSLLPLRA
jgi:hypothetical protein